MSNAVNLTPAEIAALRRLTKQPLARVDVPYIEPVFALQPMADGSNDAELWIYGPIGSSWWDDTSVSANDVIEELKGQRLNTITVRLNTYGGSVSDGVAIHNELRRHADTFGTKIIVEIGSVAASIGSLIACAGDEVRMPANALEMLHAPWGFLWVEGNAQEMRDAADSIVTALEKFGKAMAPSYARKSGRPVSEYEAMWATGKDYWYTATEALEAGLVDVITGQPAETPAESRAAFRPLVASAGNYAPALQAALRGEIPVHSSARPSNSTMAGTAVPSTQEPPMSDKTTAPNPPASTPAAPAGDSAAAAATFTADLAKRNQAIRAASAPHMGNPAVAKLVNDTIDAADPNVTAENVGLQILAVLGNTATPLNGGAHVEAGADAKDKRVIGIANAIVARTGREPLEKGNEFNGLSLKEIARACAEAAGVNTRGMDPHAYIRAAFTHTSSDFPTICNNVTGAALLRGYEAVPEVFESLARAVTVTDFRPTELVGLGTFIGIETVEEGEEYKYGTFTANDAQIKLAKLGGIFSITEEAIINDNLSVFSTVPEKMGSATKTALGDEFFALITKNVVMRDGKTLFHADHGNILQGAVLSTASLDAAFSKMAVSKDADGKLIRLRAAVVGVPVGMGSTARQILKSEYEVGGAKNLTVPNVMQGRFTVVEDPRLDVADPKAWYVIADPALNDTFVIANLNGRKAPEADEQRGFDVDGIKYKVRLFAKAGVVDHRGIIKNPGV